MSDQCGYLVLLIQRLPRETAGFRLYPHTHVG